MSKPYLTTDQQIRLLADRKGILIPDEAFAKQTLTDIGYFFSHRRIQKSLYQPNDKTV